jgi:hypothetical protein
MLMYLSDADKELMQEQGYRYGVCVKIPVFPNFTVSLAGDGESKDWGCWTILVHRGNNDITYDIFPEPQMRANQEVPATADNIQRAIETCKLIYESEEHMDVSWLLTKYTWGDMTDTWYVSSVWGFTSLLSALAGLAVEMNKEYAETRDPIEWHSGLRFVNDTNECPSSRATIMWKLDKITAERG